MLTVAVLLSLNHQVLAQTASISETLYFPDAASENARRVQLHEQLPALVEDLNKAQGKELLTQLERVETMIVDLQRHAAYARLQTLNNVDDRRMSASSSVVRSDIVMLRKAVDNRLLLVPREQHSLLGRFAKQASDNWKNAKESTVHQLSSDVARYAGKVTTAFQKSVARTYSAQIEQLDAVSPSASSNLATGRLEQSSSITSTLASRRAEIAARATRYEMAAPAIASLLASQIDLLNRDAVERGFPNAAAQKYADLGTSSSLLGATLLSFEAEAPAYQRYQRLLRDHAKKKLGLSDIKATDLAMSKAAMPLLTLDEASTLILDALAPLGSDFQQRMRRLLDPANGRLGLSGGTHRSTASGTVIAVYDAPLAVYMGNFQGKLKQVATLAHEGGHAIHRGIMNESGLATYQRNGPAYMFEAHGILNELLLLNHVAETAKSPTHRIAALETFLEKIALEVFGSAQETAFERALYEAQSGNTMLQRSDIDKLYQAAIAPYEIWPMSEVGTSQAWMLKTHVFDDPLYYTNYLYSGLSAFTLFTKIKEDPAFAPRYEALLHRGFDAPADVLLASVDINLNDPSLLKNAIKIFSKKTEELRKLYIEVGELDTN